MPEVPLVRLPPLAGRQRESWRALAELAPALGERCLLVGGQMVLLHEVERGADDTRPTDDVDVVIDLRVEPTGLARLLGPHDREQAQLTRKERTALRRIDDSAEMSALAQRSLRLIADSRD